MGCLGKPFTSHCGIIHPSVQGTEGWLLQRLEGLLARASRAVHRIRREEDRVAAVDLIARDLRACL